MRVLRLGSADKGVLDQFGRAKSPRRSRAAESSARSVVAHERGQARDLAAPESRGHEQASSTADRGQRHHAPSRDSHPRRRRHHSLARRRRVRAPPRRRAADDATRPRPSGDRAQRRTVRRAVDARHDGGSGRDAPCARTPRLGGLRRRRQNFRTATCAEQKGLQNNTPGAAASPRRDSRGQNNTPGPRRRRDGTTTDRTQATAKFVKSSKKRGHATMLASAIRDGGLPNVAWAHVPSADGSALGPPCINGTGYAVPTTVIARRRVNRTITPRSRCSWRAGTCF